MHFALTDFEATVRNTFSQLWGETAFTDVTLVTEDDQEIRAHKVILSSASDFFKKILTRNPQQETFLFLQGIRFEDLEQVVRFVYLGRCEVGVGQVEGFLHTARRLGLTSVVENLQENGQFAHETKKPVSDCEMLEEASQVEATQENKEANEHEIYSHDLDLDKKESYDEELFLDHSDESKIFQSTIKDDGQILQDKNVSQPEYQPKTKLQTKLTIKEKHDLIGDTVQFVCPDCSKIFSYRNTLNKHKRSVHSGVRYSCAECDFQATNAGHLATHKKSIHEGVRYSCYFCGHQSTSKCNLARHTKNVHEKTKTK